VNGQLLKKIYTQMIKSEIKTKVNKSSKHTFLSNQDLHCSTNYFAHQKYENKPICFKFKISCEVKKLLKNNQIITANQVKKV